VRVLFGSIFGLSTSDVRTSVVLAAVASGLVLAIGRPLLFASLDTDVAAARGVPVRVLGLAFLAVLGLVAAEATQAVGALLLLGLLAAPAGAAHRLTARTYRGLALSALFSIGSVWIGLILSYEFPTLPPSSMIIGSAVGIYVMAFVLTARESPARAAGPRRRDRMRARRRRGSARARRPWLPSAARRGSLHRRGARSPEAGS